MHADVCEEIKTLLFTFHGHACWPSRAACRRCAIACIARVPKPTATSLSCWTITSAHRDFEIARLEAAIASLDARRPKLLRKEQDRIKLRALADEGENSPTAQPSR